MKLPIIILALSLSACATQRYGRETQVSTAEKKALSCREIKLEKAKTEEFITSVRQQRSSTNAAHVLGFLGDFGVGNVLEGDAAENSGYLRLNQLNDLEADKC